MSVTSSTVSVRRKTKISEKRFVCSYEGCIKSFSRSEHLSRHQLNHYPKRIFRCDHCDKTFVRNDLLSRHRERLKRHNSNGSVSSSETNAPPTMVKRMRYNQPDQPPQPHLSHLQAPPSDFGFPTTAENNHANMRTYSFMENSRGTSDAAQKSSSGSFINPFLPNNAIEQPHLFDNQTPSPSQLASPSHVSGSASTVPLFGDDFNLTGMSGGFAAWLFDDTSTDIAAAAAAAGFNITHQRKSNASEVTLQIPSTSQCKTLSHAAAPGTTVPPNHNPVHHTPAAANGATIPKFHFPSLSVHELITPATADCDTVQASHRAKIISTLSSIPDLETNPNFTLERLRRYYDTYWTFFHPQIPILHKAMGVIDDMPVLLLITLVHMGMAREPDEAGELSDVIHDKLRWLVFGSEHFRPPAKLWVLQCLLLIEVFGKLCTKRLHHEMAHIFHGTLITLMRRGTALGGVSEPRKESATRADLTSTWYKWIDMESTKRTAFFAFIIDSQHATTNGHSLIMSVHELRLALPCSDTLWEASSPQAWSRILKQEKPPPTFLQTLKIFLSSHEDAASQSRIPPLDPFGRYIILHGLFSVTWFMQQRDAYAMGLPESRPAAAPPSSADPSYSFASKTYWNENWRDILTRTYGIWKEEVNTSIAVDPSLSFDPFTVACVSLYRIGHISLHTNTSTIQAWAGVKKILGRVVSHADSVKADKSMRELCLGVHGPQVAFHATQLIRETFMDPSITSRILHHKFCLYLACVILWAFAYFTCGSPHEYLDLEDQVANWKSAEQWLHGVGNTPESLIAYDRLQETIGLLTSVRKLLQRDDGPRCELTSENIEYLRLLSLRR